MTSWQDQYYVFDLLILIEKIRDRPLLYLTEESIECFDCYIGGWIHGVGDRQIGDKDLLYNFSEWVTNKYKKPGPAGWVRTIKFYSNDSHHALIMFFELWDEYNEISRRDTNT